MAKKKKKPRLRVAKEARRRARLGIGLPPAERTIPDKREKPGKHKDTLGDLLTNECAALSRATSTAVAGFLKCLGIAAPRTLYPGSSNERHDARRVLFHAAVPF
jgi:hypothetical protein